MAVGPVGGLLSFIGSMFFSWDFSFSPHPLPEDLQLVRRGELRVGLPMAKREVISVSRIPNTLVDKAGK